MSLWNAVTEVGDMVTKLIRLQDDTLVEVEVPEVAPDQPQQVAGKFADGVDGTIDRLKPTLLKVCKPLVETWTELNQEVHLEQAEVEVGLSFDIEGNVYLAKAKTSANIKVKLVLKP